MISPKVIALAGSALLCPLAAATEAAYKDFVETYDPMAMEGEEGEARTVFTSGGTYFIALNTTYLLLYSLLFGLGLLAALALGSLFGGGGGEAAQDDYGYAEQSYSTDAHGHYAQKRSLNTYDNDLAVQMQQLAHAFKKYEVSELECHMYVACEAAMENKHEENGVLARKVFEIMSRIKKHGRESVDRKDKYVGELLGSFLFGQSSEWEDPCVNLRSKCYEATKKPQA